MSLPNVEQLAAWLKSRRYVWGWRLRYWWMDTPSGARAHVVSFCLAVLATVGQLARMAVAAHSPPTAEEPLQAVPFWVVQLIILVVAGVVAYALRPKPQPPEQRKVEPPTVEDGTAVKDYGGTVWIEHDDNFLLAWKVVGQDPIYGEGGKK
ncbi:hypothetical protein ACFQ2D_08355 [Luteimonas composti]|uniref:hypothetical protein n=1 Tax=Luteimonas composti TaxID=398257 RepID=UPI003636591A